MRETPIKIVHKDNTGEDPYPWLDKEDPQRNLTDKQIFEDKIKL